MLSVKLEMITSLTVFFVTSIFLYQYGVNPELFIIFIQSLAPTTITFITVFSLEKKFPILNQETIQNTIALGVIILGILIVFILIKTSNNPPEILVLEPESQIIYTGEKTSINLIASDKDEDALEYNWSTNYGSFSSGQTTSKVIYLAPNSFSGRVTISVVVTDGHNHIAKKSVDIIVQNK